MFDPNNDIELENLSPLIRSSVSDGKSRILSLSSTRLINLIKHEHSCKNLYVLRLRACWAVVSYLQYDQKVPQ